MSATLLNATLIDRKELTDDLAIVKVEPGAGVVPPFEPGQYIILGLPKPDLEGGVKTKRDLVRRAYSISSTPGDDQFEFYIVRVPAGRFTPQLFDLPEGAGLWIEDTARGHFTLAGTPADKDLVLIATGTGLAPYISMLRTYSEAAPKRWRRCVVIHGARYVRDLGYRDELEAGAAGDDSIVYIPTVTRESADSDWRGLRGRVQGALDDDVYQARVGAKLSPKDCEVFLCGNPAMVDSVQALLEARGFVTDQREQRGNLHFERYW